MSKTSTTTEEPVETSAINKYNIYDLKSTLESKILEEYESNGYTEDNYFINTKILIGFVSLIATAIAYLNNGTFPENYNLILICVAIYFSTSTIYWYFEKYVFQNIFLVLNEKNSNSKCSKIILSSDIEELTDNYKLGIQIADLKGKKSDIIEKKYNFRNYFDERGYIVSSEVKKIVSEINSNILTLIKSL